MAAAGDALFWYEASGADVTAAALAENRKDLSKVLSGLGNKVIDDLFQKERLLEHYHDQALTVTQQLFSALGQARLLFPADRDLDELIRRIEDLPDYDYQKPDKVEMLKQADINAFLEVREKNAAAKIKTLYGQPLDQVLAYLKLRIDVHNEGCIKQQNALCAEMGSV